MVLREVLEKIPKFENVRIFSKAQGLIHEGPLSVFRAIAEDLDKRYVEKGTPLMDRTVTGYFHRVSTGWHVYIP